MGIHAKIIRLIALFFVAVLFCAPLPALAAAKTAAEIEAEIKQQEREFQKIQSQMSKVNKNIKEKQRQEKNVAEQIGVLSQKITVTQQKVNVVSLKMRKVQNNIFVLSNNIKEANKNIGAAQEILKKRLVNIYKYGGVAEFNLLLSSQGGRAREFLPARKNRGTGSEAHQRSGRAKTTPDDDAGGAAQGAPAPQGAEQRP